MNERQIMRVLSQENASVLSVRAEELKDNAQDAAESGGRLSKGQRKHRRRIASVLKQKETDRRFEAERSKQRTIQLMHDMGDMQPGAADESICYVEAYERGLNDCKQNRYDPFQFSTIAERDAYFAGHSGTDCLAYDHHKSRVERRKLKGKFA